MATYVGFLRAINLGAARKFPKAAIVRATEAAGFTGVATYINTGNVRFESPSRRPAELERRLEEAFAAETGFEVPTIVFTPAQLREVVDRAAGLAEEYVSTWGSPGRHYVSLLKKEPDAKLSEMLRTGVRPGEAAVVHGHAVHLILPPEPARSQLSNATVEKRLGVATNRNLNVIRTIVERWC